MLWHLHNHIPLIAMDLTDTAATNTAFKRIIDTKPNLQATVMHLGPRDEIGVENHPKYDQMVMVTDGHGYADLDGRRVSLGPGSALLIRGGVRHNVTNSDTMMPLKLVVTYTPAKFPKDGVYWTREEAEAYH